MTARLALFAALLLAAPAAFAERADRDKPMHLEASRLSIDDAKKIQILEGDVIITKGTMSLKAEKIVISEDPYGFQLGTATGGGKTGLARFRQKREGRDEYIEGEAERIEYNGNSEVVELFKRAWVKSGADEIRGDYIRYDAVNEKYEVTAGNNSNPNARSSRVIGIITPKSSNTPSKPPAANSPPLELKGATGINDADARP
jgi:lipopolysaccharide export system protein LptA